MHAALLSRLRKELPIEIVASKTSTKLIQWVPKFALLHLGNKAACHTIPKKGAEGCPELPEHFFKAAVTVPLSIWLFLLPQSQIFGAEHSSQTLLVFES